MAALAEPVARRLGWDERRIAISRFGAPLHDIGKVSVRRDLLRKAGAAHARRAARDPRAPDERAPSSSRRSARAPAALPYVLFHHERWDGSGYPTGLRGRSIPFEARLLAVADAFDAMTSARPYRPALSVDLALIEIAACAGSQFDPTVAEAFLEVWSEQVAELPVAVAS